MPKVRVKDAESKRKKERKLRSRVNRLRGLKIDEIHLVERPANLQPFLLMKGGKMPELGEMEEVDLEGLELEDVEIEDEDRSALNKALDVIKALVHRDRPEDEEIEKSLQNAVKMALRLLGKYEDNEKVKKAIELLSAVAGEKTEKPKDKDLEKAKDGDASALVNAVKAFLKVAKANWDKLPPDVQTKVESLAEAVGYEAYEEKYPEVKKSEEVVALEKAMSEQAVRLQKMEEELNATRREKRLIELEPISKSVGSLPVETLYKLEQYDPKLFKDIVAHMETIQKRVETSEFFSKEIGSSKPVAPDSAVDRLDRAAREAIEKGMAQDYASALAMVSAMPEYQHLIPELYATGGEQ